MQKDSDEARDQVGANAGGSDSAQLTAGRDAQRNLSRTLVHDLRNALAPISNAVYLLQLRGREDAALAQITDIIDRQVTAIVRMLNDPDEAAPADRSDPRSDPNTTAGGHAAQSQTHNSKLPKV